MTGAPAAAAGRQERSASCKPSRPRKSERRSRYQIPAASLPTGRPLHLLSQQHGTPLPWGGVKPAGARTMSQRGTSGPTEQPRRRCCRGTTWPGRAAAGVVARGIWVAPFAASAMADDGWPDQHPRPSRSTPAAATADDAGQVTARPGSQLGRAVGVVGGRHVGHASADDCSGTGSTTRSSVYSAPGGAPDSDGGRGTARAPGCVERERMVLGGVATRRAAGRSATKSSGRWPDWRSEFVGDRCPSQKRASGPRTCVVMTIRSGVQARWRRRPAARRDGPVQYDRRSAGTPRPTAEAGGHLVKVALRRRRHRVEVCGCPGTTWASFNVQALAARRRSGERPVPVRPANDPSSERERCGSCCTPFQDDAGRCQSRCHSARRGK